MSSDLATVTIKRRRALPFFSRHPWVFAGAIAHMDREPQVGEEVRVCSHQGEFIARGLYNPHSNIRVRLYSWEESVSLDEAFWSARLDEAIALRRSLFEDAPEAQACRIVFSEADQLSGLTVDRYNDWLLVQWTSHALATRRDLFMSLLQEKLSPRGIWLRTERGVGEAEGLEIRDGLVAGKAPPRPCFISENGLSFGVDVTQGQKTGFFFDQRENRRAVAKYARGKHVLDAFCYTGGFGITAAKLGNAARVTCVDSSEPALLLAQRNAELNDVAASVSCVQADVADYLRDALNGGERFGLIILDPPKMARRRAALDRAAQGYALLNRRAIELLEPAGILVTCSCSGLLETESFLDIIARSASEAGRHIQILEQRGQAADHPVSLFCRETSYLKCLIARVL